MRVLHVIPSVSKAHGGPSQALAMMERSLTDIGTQVTTATTDDDGPGRRLHEASQFVNVNGAERYYARKWSDFYKFAPSLLFWLLRHCRCSDVVHIHALFSFCSIAAAFAAWLRGVPYIIRPLGTLNTYGVRQRRPVLKALSFWLIESRVLRHAAAVQFTSQAEWNEASKLLVPMRGVVLPLGIEAMRACDAGPPFEAQPGQTIVLFLSRLDRKKNIESLLSAFALARRIHPNALLVIAGDGDAEYVRFLRGRAEAEQVMDAVVWTGYIEGDAKWSTFLAADIFVLPSFSENFGIAAVEAMMAGVPCILGCGVAIGEAVAAAGAGVVTKTDPTSIAAGMELLLSNSPLRTRMGALARTLAEREYSTVVMAKRLVELYEQVVAAVPSGR